DADAPLPPLGVAAPLDLRPRLAGVGRLPQAGAGAAGVQRVRRAVALPARCVQHVGIARVDLHVDEAGAVADELDQLPRTPAVGRLVETALGVRLPRGA